MAEDTGNDNTGEDTGGSQAPKTPEQKSAAQQAADAYRIVNRMLGPAPSAPRTDPFLPYRGHDIWRIRADRNVREGDAQRVKEYQDAMQQRADLFAKSYATGMAGEEGAVNARNQAALIAAQTGARKFEADPMSDPAVQEAMRKAKLRATEEQLNLPVGSLGGPVQLEPTTQEMVDIGKKAGAMSGEAAINAIQNELAQRQQTIRGRGEEPGPASSVYDIVRQVGRVDPAIQKAVVAEALGQGTPQTQYMKQAMESMTPEERAMLTRTTGPTGLLRLYEGIFPPPSARKAGPISRWFRGE